MDTWKRDEYWSFYVFLCFFLWKMINLQYWNCQGNVPWRFLHRGYGCVITLKATTALISDGLPYLPYIALRVIHVYYTLLLWGYIYIDPITVAPLNLTQQALCTSCSRLYIFVLLLIIEIKELWVSISWVKSTWIYYVVCCRKCIEPVTSSWVVLQCYIRQSISFISRTPTYIECILWTTFNDL